MSDTPWWMVDEPAEIPWSENDGLLEEQLEIGHDWEEYVAGELRARGFYARFGPDRTFRESIADNVRYKSQVDVTVLNKEYEYIRIEVKSRELSFTSPGTFPFPTVFVMSVNSWHDCAEEKRPHVVVSVSQETGAIIALNTERTRELWVKEWAYDSTRRIWDWFYALDKRHWRSFDALCHWLDGQCNRFTVTPLDIPDPDPSKLKEKKVVPNDGRSLEAMPHFLAGMMKKINDNDHKIGWRHEDLSELYWLLEGEVRDELRLEITDFLIAQQVNHKQQMRKHLEDAMQECHDVANSAFFIADKCALMLKELTDGRSQEND